MVALITLGPTLNLIFLAIDIQSLGRLLFLLNLPTVLTLQPLLLFLLIRLLLLLLHLRVHVFLEACEFLGLRVVAYG